MVRRLTWALLALAACSDEGIGRPCKPTLPCDANGANCGFNAAETYVSTNSSECPGEQACVVYHLDNGSNGTRPSDPNVVCTGPGTPEGCVTEEAVERSVYCSCPCAREGSDDRSGLCTCGDGFVCASAGGGPNWYCVKN